MTSESSQRRCSPLPHCLQQSCPTRRLTATTPARSRHATAVTPPVPPPVVCCRQSCDSPTRTGRCSLGDSPRRRRQSSSPSDCSLVTDPRRLSSCSWPTRGDCPHGDCPCGDCPRGDPRRLSSRRLSSPSRDCCRRPAATLLPSPLNHDDSGQPRRLFALHVELAAYDLCIALDTVQRVSSPPWSPGWSVACRTTTG